jgi:hypothetical protein
MGVNGSYAFRNHFFSYFAPNPEFVGNNVARISRIDSPHIFVRSSVRRLCLHNNVPSNRLYCFDGDLGGVSDRISIDLTGVLPWGPTALFSIALPAALWWGFTSIVLLGADFPVQGYRRFHENLDDAPTHSRRQLSEYEAEMEIARFRARLWQSYLREKHPSVEVVNCSPGSELGAFAEADLGSSLA